MSIESQEIKSLQIPAIVDITELNNLDVGHKVMKNI